MEDDRRRVREYYQVNLDTGRIFWIAFLIGLVLIGILVLGIFVGGGKLKNGLTVFEKPAQTPGGPAAREAPTKNGIPLLNLFENNLTAETKYIDAKEAEKSALESSKQTLDSARLFEEETPEALDAPAAVEQAEKTKAGTAQGSAALRSRAEAPKKIHERERRHVEKGDYFIQVASFEREENAHSFAERLRKRLYKVSIEEAKVGERQFYRVRVGPFETKGVAVNTMSTMRKHFDLKDPFVVKKDS